MARVKFRTTCITRHGTYSTGDVLVTSDEFARHLVDDCGAADYCAEAAPEIAPDPAPADPPAEKRAARRKG